VVVAPVFAREQPGATGQSPGSLFLRAQACPPRVIPREMKRSQNRLPGRLSDQLRRVIAAEFGEDRRACNLFEDFLEPRPYRSDFSLKLLEIGQGETKDSWEIRRLAILMLEHEVLKLPVEKIAEYEALYTRLDLKSNAEPPGRLKDSVLQEGYSTVTLPGFTVEFRRRLARLCPIHCRLAGRRTSQAALRSFVRQSRRECQLTLARYCFTPAEVITRIRQQLRISRGVKDLSTFDPFTDERLIREEVASSLASLPDYEAAILKGLCQGSAIYWVSETTSSELNSLVEFPIGTVVAVIKPPGSQLEFEIKRTGSKGACPLKVLSRRDGKLVPVSHHLVGGSMGKQLGFEARSGARFAHLYRNVHGCYPPLSSVHSISTIYTVPASNGDEHLLSYFTEARAFGKGYAQMRREMKEVVNSLSESYDSAVQEVPGDLGMTVQFLGLLNPAQAVLAGSSSFRLDRLATYLSDHGPEKYFKDGLGVPYTKSDARWFADELMREILPDYTPPPAQNYGYKEYLVEALRINRACADNTYLSAVKQLGVCWGTLLGAGGYSWGESFVDRNVGLKGYWDSGQRQVQLILMDHDNLFLNGYETGNFHPLEAMQGMLKDEKFIRGEGRAVKPVTGTLSRLRNIYGAEEHVAAEGTRQFYQSLKEAYRKTQGELVNNPKLRRCFSHSFIEQICYWNSVARSYLKMKQEAGDPGAWRRQTAGRIARTWKLPILAEEYLKAAEEYGDLLERYSLLYQH